MTDIELSGRAVIDDGAIVIRVALDALPQVVEGAWACNKLPVRYKLTNVEAFARDLVTELNREAEDGTTRVHVLFDGAIEEALEQGAEGIEEHEEQDA